MQEPRLLPELPIQFADFAVWQEEWRASTSRHKPSLEFWHAPLGKDFTPLQLTHDPDAARRAPGAQRGQHRRHRNAACSARSQGPRPCLLQARERHAEYPAVQRLRRSAAPAHRTARSHHRFPLRQPHEDTRGAHRPVHEHPGACACGSTRRHLPRPAYPGCRLDARRLEHQTLPFEDLVHDPFFAAGRARSKFLSSSSTKNPSC